LEEAGGSPFTHARLRGKRGSMEAAPNSRDLAVVPHRSRVEAHLADDEEERHGTGSS
jgi:hypothetical protein